APAMGGTCGQAVANLYDGNSCNAQEGNESLVPNQCGTFNTSDQSSSIRGSAPVLAPGSCTPSGGAATLPPVAFDQDAVVCSGSEVGAGCPGVGDVCAP